MHYTRGKNEEMFKISNKLCLVQLCFQICGDVREVLYVKYTDKDWAFRGNMFVGNNTATKTKSSKNLEKIRNGCIHNLITYLIKSQNIEDKFSLFVTVQ